MVVGQGRALVSPWTPGSDPDRACCAAAIPTPANRPCVVAFSGGRDSSALLAVLVDVARREGLPEPIAVTARWDDDRPATRAPGRSRSIATVGARDWEIIRPGTDLDLLGEEALASSRARA